MKQANKTKRVVEPYFSNFMIIGEDHSILRQILQMLAQNLNHLGEFSEKGSKFFNLVCALPGVHAVKQSDIFQQFFRCDVIATCECF